MPPKQILAKQMPVHAHTKKPPMKPRPPEKPPPAHLLTKAKEEELRLTKAKEEEELPLIKAKEEEELRLTKAGQEEGLGQPPKPNGYRLIWRGLKQSSVSHDLGDDRNAC